MNDWRSLAAERLGGIETIRDFPMSRLTTFQIGGPIDLLVQPQHTGELQRVLQFCAAEGVPWMVLGLGSNLLVRDKGIRGIGIKLAGEFLEWRMDGPTARAGAGLALGDLSRETACLGWSGLEFACGIPGTVGGAVFMNAGAYDGEIGQVLTVVEACYPDGGCVRLNASDLELGYRFSRFQREKAVITRADFGLRPAAKADAEARITELTCQRQSKQPLEMPSAGSVFRRPAGYYVGPLIEQAGLKGFRIGGAQVSPKHAGFIVNAGGATAADVLALIEHIRREIRERSGVELVPEVRVIGEE
jgi:UDP-N-acetylmuramate dehydrogenase